MALSSYILQQGPYLEIEPCPIPDRNAQDGEQEYSVRLKALPEAACQQQCEDYTDQMDTHVRKGLHAKQLC